MRRTFVLSLSLASVALGPVWAADEPAPAGGGILEGPKVDEAAEEGRDGFGMDERPDGKMRQRGPSARPRVWFNALKQLDLTTEQREKVQPIVEEFTRLRNEFETANGDQIKELETTLKAARDAGKPDRELAQKVKGLRDKAPKPEPYMERIWELLTADQQETMRARLAELEKAAPRSGQRREEREGADPMQPAEGPMTPAADERPRRRDRTAPKEPSLEGLDELAKRRAEFLRAHKSSAKAPTEAPRGERFHFDSEAEDDVARPAP
jgi:hypothetical protein